jgi:creatinine amidohydrolase
MGMPGTILLPDEVFVGMLKAIMAGFWNAGFRKMILLNGHGQEYVIPVAVQEFGKRYQVPAIIINISYFVAISDKILDKSCGGPFETPWTHADECETSYALNFMPELINMEDAVDTKGGHCIPEDHFDRPGQGMCKPIPFYAEVGCAGMEAITHPEGVVGAATLADAKKIQSAAESFLDYMVKLHDDILEAFPPGKLPDNVTQRSKEELEAVLKGPTAKGGKSIYTLGWPP